MINTKEFRQMQKELEGFDEERESAIATSRKILHLSKQLIYALHRDDRQKAKKMLSLITLSFAEARKQAQKTPGLASEGFFRVASQEYVEACSLYWFITEKRLATRDELETTTEEYLLGVCDVAGELVRLAVNRIIKGDMNSACAIRDFVSELYSLLLEFSFRNGDLRKKFDSVKYNLQKLEDLVLQIKMQKK